MCEVDFLKCPRSILCKEKVDIKNGLNKPKENSEYCSLEIGTQHRPCGEVVLLNFISRQPVPGKKYDQKYCMQ